MHETTVDALARQLGTGAPFAALVGAGVSGVRPSNLPLASRWVLHVLQGIASRTDPLFSPPQGFDDLAAVATTNRLVIPLEGLFQACEDAAPGLGSALAAVVGDPSIPVNPLTEAVAQAALDSKGRILTTNFDLLLETAYARHAGAPPEVWVAGEPWRDAAVLKLHGSADRPGTLRHTFRTVNEQFDASTAQHLRNSTSGTLVVLGYAGADFDVMDVVVDSSATSLGPCFWLVRAGDDVPPGAERMAQTREVHIARGDFDAVLSALGLSRAGFQPDGAGIWPRTDHLLNSLSHDQALDILGPLLYQARVGHPPAAPVFHAFREYLRQRRREDPRRFHFLEASEAQFVRGVLVQWLRAAWHFVRAADESNRWICFSHAAEALERVFFGLAVPLRILSLPIHRAATNRVRGAERARMRTRWARSASALGRHRRAVALLTAAEAEIEYDTYHEGILRKRRALALALIGDRSWAADIAKAHRNFEFENRTVEMGDLTRTEAACRFLTGDRAGGIDLMERSRRMHLDHQQSVGAFRSLFLRIAMERAPWLVRLALAMT